MRRLKLSGIRVRSPGTWKSAKTNTEHPSGWEITVAPLNMKLRVKPRLDDQELSLDPVTCREGAVSVKGAAAGRPVTGLWYGELAGYSPKAFFADIDF